MVPGGLGPHDAGATLDQVGSNLQATVAGLRQEILEQEATYARLWQDTDYLEENLATPPPRR